MLCSTEIRLASTGKNICLATKTRRSISSITKTSQSTSLITQVSRKSERRVSLFSEISILLVYLFISIGLNKINKSNARVPILKAHIAQQEEERQKQEREDAEQSEKKRLKKQGKEQEKKRLREM